MKFLVFYCIFYIPVVFAYTKYDVVCNCTHAMENIYVESHNSHPDNIAYQKCGEQIAQVLNRKGTPLYEIKSYTATFKNTDSVKGFAVYECLATTAKQVGTFVQNSKTKTISSLRSGCTQLIRTLMHTLPTFTDRLFRRPQPFWVKAWDSHVTNCTPPTDF